MNPRLLEYYERELRHIRRMGGEYAAEYPKIAGRLGLDAFECADPYVERLLEGRSGAVRLSRLGMLGMLCLAALAIIAVMELTTSDRPIQAEGDAEQDAQDAEPNASIMESFTPLDAA